jgi:uncharacterized protein YndB with AHSA1/START domain
MMGDTGLDLAIDRLIDAPVGIVWRAWTQHTDEWWCPAPWSARVVAMELEPGGRFATLMRGPAGEEVPTDGVVLEVVPGRRIVTTDAYRKGWVPAEPFMTGIWTFEPEGDRTRYRAAARHWTAEARDRHRDMGFEQGWGAVTDQLAAVAQRLARG